MKRRLIIIAVFLLLGVVVNVAVAWGCAMWLVGGTGHVSGHTWLDDTHLWSVVATTGEGVGQVTSFVEPIQESIRSEIAAAFQTDPPAESALPRWSDLVSPDLGDPATLPRRYQSAFGWPYLALTYHGVDKEKVHSAQFPPVEIRGAIVLYRSRFGTWALPFLPIWAGFLANSTFYGAGLWLVWFLKILRPFTLLRRLRIKRGLCPACGYPMGDSSVCTECGRLLPKRVAT